MASATNEADVVVVGAGNAACAAAMAARDTGASVIMLEAAPREERGGNSTYTAGATRMVYNGVDDVRSLQGLPVRGIIPKEGANYVDVTLAELKNAPHPNATRVLINYFLSDDSQRLLSTYSGRGPTGILSDDVPAELRDLYEAPLLGEIDPFKRDDFVRMLEGLMGKR